MSQDLDRALDRTQVVRDVHALYGEIVAALHLHEVPTLNVGWNSEDPPYITGVCTQELGSEASTRIRVTLSAHPKVGAVHVAATLLHEVTHAEGHWGHRRDFRQALADSALVVWGFSAHDATRTARKSGIDHVIEYRLWQSKRLLTGKGALLAASLGDPPVPVPTFPLGPFRVTGRTGRLLAQGMGPLAGILSSRRLRRTHRYLINLPVEALMSEMTEAEETLWSEAPLVDEEERESIRTLWRSGSREDAIEAVQQFSDLAAVDLAEAYEALTTGLGTNDTVGEGDFEDEDDLDDDTSDEEESSDEDDGDPEDGDPGDPDDSDDE